MSEDKTLLTMDNTLDGYASEQIEVISNGLLGAYDDDGHYTISEPVKQELVNMTKYKKTTFNNSVFCVVNRPGLGELVFKIDYEKNTNDQVAKATMYVLENLYKVNGYLQNTIKTPIAEFVGDLDNFIETSYRKFNVNVIWSDDDDEGMERKGEDDPSVYAYISAQKQFISALDRLTTDKYNKIYEEYFTERLRVLNAQGTDFSRAVLETFRQEYAKIEKFFLSAKDYKALSQLLDVCVEKNKLSRAPKTPQEQAQVAQEQQYIKAITPSIEKFSKAAEQIRESAVEKAKNRLSKDDKQRVEEIQATPAKEVAPAQKETTQAPKKETPTLTKSKGKEKEESSKGKGGKEAENTKTTSSDTNKVNDTSDYWDYFETLKKERSYNKVQKNPDEKQKEQSSQTQVNEIGEPASESSETAEALSKLAKEAIKQGSEDKKNKEINSDVQQEINNVVQTQPENGYDNFISLER